MSETPPVSIVIATLNERENIEATIRAIISHIDSLFEIIVVDDASADGTADFVDSLDDPRVKVIRRRRGRGLASAITRGIVECRGDIIGWIDADMAHETRYLPAMIEKNADHDVVIASRFAVGGGDERHPIRVFCSRLINGFANLVLGYGIRDYDSCVATVRRSVFDDVLPVAYGYGDFFIEFVYGCRRRGLSVIEHPYVLTAREGGESKSAPDPLGFLWLGFKYCVRVLSTRFRPD